MIDAAGEWRAFTRDTVAALDRNGFGIWRERCRERHIEAVGPYRLLSFLGILADHMTVVDDETCAPAVGGVGLADLAHNVEPRLEAEPVAADLFRQQDASKARIEHFLNRLRRDSPRLFRRLCALGEARREGASAVNHLGAGDALRCRRGKGHIVLLL